MVLKSFMQIQLENFEPHLKIFPHGKVENHRENLRKNEFLSKNTAKQNVRDYFLIGRRTEPVFISLSHRLVSTFDLQSMKNIDFPTRLHSWLSNLFSLSVSPLKNYVIMR